MRSHPLSFPIDAQCNAYETLENYLCDTQTKVIRILLSRTAMRKKKGKIYSRGAAYGATSEAALSYSFWSFGDERGRRSWVYLTLVPPPRSRGFSSRIPAPCSHLFLPSPSVETLLTKRATIPRSIPSECPGVVFRSLGTTTVTEDVDQTSVWILQSSEKCYENKQAKKQDIFSKHL